MSNKIDEDNCIEKETVVISERDYIKYTTCDKEFNTLHEALKKKYGNQGQLYSDVFGINEEDAKRAGWFPEDTQFSVAGSTGWNHFISDGGVVEKTITKETVNVKDEIAKHEDWGYNNREDL